MPTPWTESAPASGPAGAEVRQRKQVGVGAQVADEKAGQRFWLEIDGGQRRGGQRDRLEAVVAAGGVGELRSGAVTGVGGPGPCPAR
jgi:hypothetical protein